jgi:hypothetical protein
LRPSRPWREVTPASNAVNGGDPLNGCFGPDGQPLLTDQRGLARTAGDRCDVGAFEYQSLFFYVPVIGADE